MTLPLKRAAQAIALAAVAGLLALLVWKVTHQPTPVKLGKRAPAFTARRLDGGGTVSLASFRGRPVVLNFWASWCGPCKSEAPALEKTWQEYRKHGLVVLGVDYNDATSDAKAFVSKKGLTFPMVRDKEGTIGERYDLTGVPETFIIGRNGRVIEHLLAPVDESKNADAFAQGLQAALKS